MDDPRSLRQGLRVSIDEFWIGPETRSVASRFFDSAEVMTYDDFIEARQTGEVLTLSREFNASPWSGDGGKLSQKRL